VSIAVGAEAAVEFSYDGTTSLDDLALAINTSSLGAQASVINDGQGFRLLVTGKETGAANSIQFTTVSGDAVGLEDNLLVSAQDAELRINGLQVTRASNESTDIIEGVKLEFRATSAPSSPVIVQVSADTAGVQTRLQELVDAYNDVVKLVRSELGKGAESRAGSLFGDSSAQALQRRLSGIVSEGFNHNGQTQSLASVGLKVAQGGVLTVDSAGLSRALQADPSQINSLLVGDGVSSLTARFKSVVADYTTLGTGILVSKQAGIDSRIKSYDKQIEQIDGRALRLAERLRRTFASLDQSLAQLNSQSSYLATLSRTSNF
jgi:flagellar hook-associated protein 2